MTDIATMLIDDDDEQELPWTERLDEIWPGARLISTSSVKLVKDLYPRLDHDESAVERYRDAIGPDLEPITVADSETHGEHVLVDGYHRSKAYEREDLPLIPAYDLGLLSDDEILEESVRRNNKHGVPMTQKDKTALAAKLWGSYRERFGGEAVTALSGLLRSSPRTVERATAQARAAEQEELHRQAWDLHLECLTQEQIAQRLLGKPEKHKTISNWLGNFRQASEITKDLPPQLRQDFDVWKLPGDEDSAYFGRLPAGLVENLLWLFTQPEDTVFDPFAGRGTTIRAAKQMNRRVWSSDRRGKAWDETLPIHVHDIATGWPDDAPGQAHLVILDPPYWQQAKGKYSDDDADLANQTLEQFRESWASVVKACTEHAPRIAYIISPTQLDDGTVVDHATEMLAPFTEEGWHIERRIIVPYSTQQATGQQVNWARENKRLLKLYRDLVVMAK